MKQLFDYIPLVFFFIVYKLDERLIQIGSFEYTLGGIFSATEVLIAMSILVYGGFFIVNRKLEKSQLITLVAVLIFCSFTIFFRDENILKWKAPVVNWIFASIFLLSPIIVKKNVVQLMMEHSIELPDAVWKKLNLAWGLFFLFLGAVNLVVAFTFHEYWVDFKVFGSLGMILLFIIAQTVYLTPYIKEDMDDETPSEKKLADTGKS